MDCGTPTRVRKGIYASLYKSKAISPSPYNPKTLFLLPLLQIQRAHSTSSTYDLISSLLQLQDSTSIFNFNNPLQLFTELSNGSSSTYARPFQKDLDPSKSLEKEFQRCVGTKISSQNTYHCQ